MISLCDQLTDSQQPALYLVSSRAPACTPAKRFLPIADVLPKQRLRKRVCSPKKAKRALEGTLESRQIPFEQLTRWMTAGHKRHKRCIKKTPDNQLAASSSTMAATKALTDTAQPEPTPTVVSTDTSAASKMGLTSIGALASAGIWLLLL